MKGKKTGGRHKGVPNKLTSDVKAAILHAFDAAGGAKYLQRQADDNPTAFLTLLGKVLPLQVTHDGAVGFKVEIVRYDDPPPELLESEEISTAVVARLGNGHSLC